MTVVGFDGEHRDQADERCVVGEDPDDVGAPGDLAVEALQRVGGAQLGPVLSGECVEGEHVVLGLLEQPRDLRQSWFELGDRVEQALARLGAIAGREQLTDHGTERVVLVLAGMASEIAQEVNGAALPGRAQDPRDRGLQSWVRVADGQLHPDEAPGDERPEELSPERLGLRGADVQADDLPAPGFMHGVGDHDALALNTAAVADLLDLRVDEQVGVAALQRTLAERPHLLIEQPGDPADLALGDPQPERLDELIDAPGRDAADIGLLHDRDQRLLGALARLQEAREVAALPDPRDLQLDLTRAGVPAPGPVAVAMRRAILRALTVRRADQLGNLALHQLLRDRPHRLADHVAMLLAQHLPDDLLDRHPVPTGHRRPPFVEP